MLFYFSSRYRLPAVPFLCVLAGGGARELWERWRRDGMGRRFWRLAAPAGVAFAVSITPWQPDYEMQAANQWFNLGNEYFYVDEYDQAAAYYRRALERLDQKAKIHYNLGITYKVMGRWRDAAAAFERARELDPGHPQVNAHLRESRLRAGLPPEP
jgi:tetratricopeptide (TPR) repeat protein